MLPQETKSERNIIEVIVIEIIFLVIVVMKFLQDNPYFFFQVICDPKPLYCIDEVEFILWILNCSQKLFPHFFFELTKFMLFLAYDVLYYHQEHNENWWELYMLRKRWSNNFEGQLSFKSCCKYKTTKPVRSVFTINLLK